MTAIGRPDQIDHAAELLALAASRPDGWMPASRDFQLPGYADPVAKRAWEKQLRSLLEQSPSVEILSEHSDRYPQNLRSVEGRPALLFSEGSLSPGDERAVAIVGSRSADLRAIDAATSLANSLASRGVTVVSGLARGIDAAAHRGAIEAHGRTLAVMGTGLGRLYPLENAELAEAIRQHGALLSQFPPGYGPTKTTFPARNAVIAGLSKASLIVVANERSGTRIEINNTLAQGRPVLLWSPLLASQRWASELAREPLVQFVGSVEEVEGALGQTAA
jgi:DNA processing protein